MNHESNSRRTPRKNSRRESTTDKRIIQCGEVDMMEDETKFEMDTNALMNGEVSEIEWGRPCPTCGAESDKLMWNKFKNMFYCRDASCHGWSNELEMPETDIIKDLSLALLEKKAAEDGLMETLHIIKTTCILQVESEWETTKDKALSNATKRGVEVELRVSGDEEYMMRVRQQEALHREIQRDQIELDFQRRQFQRQHGEAGVVAAIDRMCNMFDDTLDAMWHTQKDMLKEMGRR